MIAFIAQRIATSLEMMALASQDVSPSEEMIVLLSETIASVLYDRVLPRHFGPGAWATDRVSLLTQSSLLRDANRVPWRQ